MIPRARSVSSFIPVALVVALAACGGEPSAAEDYQANRELIAAVPVFPRSSAVGEPVEEPLITAEAECDLLIHRETRVRYKLPAQTKPKAVVAFFLDRMPANWERTHSNNHVAVFIDGKRSVTILVPPDEGEKGTMELTAVARAIDVDAGCAGQ